MNRLQAFFDRHASVLSFLLPLTLFCLPLGQSAKSISIAMCLVSLVGLSQTRKLTCQLFFQPLTWIIFGLFLLAILGTFWSDAGAHYKWTVVEKYSKLVFIPLFAVGFRDKKLRFYGIQAYIMGIFLSCCAYFYIYFIYMHSHQGYLPEEGYIFYNHIVTGYMMAFGCYLAAWSALHSHRTWHKVCYFILIFILSTHLLIMNASRTGYLIYGLLFLLFCMQNFSIKAVRYTVILFILSFLTVFQWTHTETLMNRIQLIQQDLREYQVGKKDTSIGFRLQFHHYAKSLFLAKPILGQGTGGFAYHFQQDKPIKWDPYHPDPHSQYWHTTSEFGLLGVSVFILLLCGLLKQSFALSEMKPILQAVLLPFCAVCYSDTVLLTSGIGYWFVIFTGLCLGEWVNSLSSK